jgi:hypothetical protein
VHVELVDAGAVAVAILDFELHFLLRHGQLADRARGPDAVTSP